MFLVQFLININLGILNEIVSQPFQQQNHKSNCNSVYSSTLIYRKFQFPQHQAAG